MTEYLPDVNVVVASVRADHPHHEQARSFVQSALARGHSFVVPVEVLASSMRILMLDVWTDPESSVSASALVRAWVDAARADVVGHPPAAFTVLAEFARTLDLSPRRIPDALLAASAITLRATLVSFDRGFSGYPGLTGEVIAQDSGQH